MKTKIYAGILYICMLVAINIPYVVLKLFRNIDIYKLVGQYKLLLDAVAVLLLFGAYKGCERLFDWIDRKRRSKYRRYYDNNK